MAATDSMSPANGLLGFMTDGLSTLIQLDQPHTLDFTVGGAVLAPELGVPDQNTT
jgi:hypothetical protein